MLAADLFEATQPIEAGHVDAAFALDGFDDDGGGVVHAAAAVGQQFVEVRDGVHALPHVPIIGHKRGAGGRDAGGIAEVGVGGGGDGPEGDTVEAIGEGDDVVPAGEVAGDLHRRFHGVGAGGAGELDLVLQIARLQDAVVKGIQKVTLGRGVGIKAVGDAVALDIGDQVLLEERVVVAVVQRAGAGEKIQVLAAIDVGQGGSAGGLKDGGIGAAVAAHIRFDIGKDAHGGISCYGVFRRKGPTRTSGSASCELSRLSADLG